MADNNKPDWTQLPPHAASAEESKPIPEASPPFNTAATGFDIPGAHSQGPLVVDTRPKDESIPPIPCLEGPCRYFAEIGQVEGVVSGLETIRRFQYCRLFEEEFGTMTLHELTIRYCSKYSPPRLSLPGLRQRLRSAPFLLRSARKFHYGTTPSLHILCAIRNILDRANLSSRLNIVNNKKDDSK